MRRLLDHPSYRAGVRAGIPFAAAGFVLAILLRRARNPGSGHDPRDRDVGGRLRWRRTLIGQALVRVLL